jgi:hypothetical protein
MKKLFVTLIGFILILAMVVPTVAAELEIQGKKLVSLKPPFTMMAPSEFRLMHSFSLEHPKENSATRAYLFVKAPNQRVEEMLIVQIADRTNPQAEPITVPPLKPDAEKRMYARWKVKRGQGEIEYLIQSIIWNPDAPSLQPIVKKGVVIPFRRALQGQFLFTYEGEHAVLIKYSKEVQSFGVKVSEKEEDWKRDRLSGNGKKAYESFQKLFLGMVDSVTFKQP